MGDGKSLREKMRANRFRNLPCHKVGSTVQQASCRRCGGYPTLVLTTDKLCRCHEPPEPRVSQVKYGGECGKGDPYVLIENIDFADAKDVQRLNGHGRLSKAIHTAVNALVVRLNAGWPAHRERETLVQAINDFHVKQAHRHYYDGHVQRTQAKKKTPCAGS